MLVPSPQSGCKGKGDGQGAHRVEPLQASVAQEQQLRLAALQLRDVVHLAEGPRLVDV